MLVFEQSMLTHSHATEIKGGALFTGKKMLSSCQTSCKGDSSREQVTGKTNRLVIKVIVGDESIYL